MTPEDSAQPQDGPQDGNQDGRTPEQPVVRDRRRIDPVTGQLREPAPAEPVPPAGVVPDAEPDPDASASDLTAEQVLADSAGSAGDVAEAAVALAAAQTLAEERLADLQRLQAEYVNYRKRVDRDRDVATTAGSTKVFEALLPVLDDVALARTHGGLSEGPAASITDKLEGVLERLGLERYGETGEPFDPAVHEALMHGHAEGIEVTTVTQVLQPGYTVAGRVLRPARVAVADPQ